VVVVELPQAVTHQAEHQATVVLDTQVPFQVHQLFIQVVVEVLMMSVTLEVQEAVDQAVAEQVGQAETLLVLLEQPTLEAEEVAAV
jgi:hypothetical protein